MSDVITLTMAERAELTAVLAISGMSVCVLGAAILDNAETASDKVLDEARGAADDGHTLAEQLGYWVERLQTGNKEDSIKAAAKFKRFTKALPRP